MRSTASCCGCSRSGRATRRPSARSRTVRPTGPSARRRCCARSRPPTPARCPMRRSAGSSAKSCPPASPWSSACRSPTSGPPGTLQPRRGRRGTSATRWRAEPCASIDEVFRAAEAGRTDYAVVPVENSTEGAVGRTLDLMCQTPLDDRRRDQAAHPADTCSRKGIASTSVTKVYSHAQSLAQCMHWLARNLPGGRARRRGQQRRGGAPGRRRTRRGGDRRRGGGRDYGLDIVARTHRGRAEQHHPLRGARRAAVPPSGKDKTSLIMSAQNKPARCTPCSSRLPRHGVSMSRLESRPARTGLWEYLFFVDVEGHQDDPARGRGARRAAPDARRFSSCWAPIRRRS